MRLYGEEPSIVGFCRWVVKDPGFWVGVVIGIGLLLSF